MDIQPTLHAGTTILDELPALTRISKVCTAVEIGQLIEILQAELDSERQRFNQWEVQAARQRELIASADLASLHAIHVELNRIELERFIAASSVANLHQSCTHYRNLLAERAVVLVADAIAVEGQGEAPVPFALISMGSDGREEQTLITDQDYLVVYGDGGGAAADRWFEKFGTRLADCLEEAGFKRCTGGIMTNNPTWRGSFSQWRKRLFAIVRYEVEDFAKNMMDLIVLSDARYVAGDKPLGERFIELVRDMQREHFQVLWGMARAATEMKLALGFMRRLWTEPSGEHKGEFNVKLLAWAPLVMNVRILAISRGLAATSTVSRIRMLEREGSFSASVAQGLLEAYEILTRHRILLQIKVIKGIQKDSYYLDPLMLEHGERERIRQAILRVEDLQKSIHTTFNIM